MSASIGGEQLYWKIAALHILESPLNVFINEHWRKEKKQMARLNLHKIFRDPTRIVINAAMIGLLLAVAVDGSVADKNPRPAYVPPSISIISPENMTYNSADATFNLSLSFHVDIPRIGMISWIGYSLDGNPDITISGNTTISVAYGFHNIVVSANDTFEGTLVSSDPAYFTVSTAMDLNGDGTVDVADISIAAVAYGSTPDDANWNPKADLAPVKGRIDLFDLITILSYYGETW
jgi:hypothetical protein